MKVWKQIPGFGVSRPAISYAVRGDTWKHIGATK